MNAAAILAAALSFLLGLHLGVQKPLQFVLGPYVGRVPAGVIEWDAEAGEYVHTELLGPGEYGASHTLFLVARGRPSVDRDGDAGVLEGGFGL